MTTIDHGSTVTTQEERNEVEDLLREAVDLDAGKYPGLDEQDGRDAMSQWLTVGGPNPYQTNYPPFQSAFNGPAYERGALEVLYGQQ